MARSTHLDPWRLERILGRKEKDTMVFAAFSCSRKNSDVDAMIGMPKHLLFLPASLAL